MPLRKLDDLELNIALEGCEGLDVNYVSRIRAQYLFIQHQTMITQMQFADAKAAALIALVGVAAVRGSNSHRPTRSVWNDWLCLFDVCRILDHVCNFIGLPPIPI